MSEAVADKVADSGSTPAEAPVEKTAPKVVEKESATKEAQQVEASKEPEEEKKGRRSRNDIRKAMKDRLQKRQADAERTMEGDDRPRDEHGRFLPKEDVPKQEGEVADAADPSKGQESAAKVADGRVRIDLPADHPLRDEGQTHIEVSPDNERTMRAALNQWTRRSELEEAKKQVAQERQLRMQVMAEIEATKAKQTQGQVPHLEHFLADLREAYGEQPELVKAIEQGLQANEKQKEQQYRQQAVQRIQMQQEATQFGRTIEASAPAEYPMWAQTGELRTRINQALIHYGDFVDARNEKLAQAGRPLSRVDKAEFDSWLRLQYQQDPRVQKTVREFQNKRRASLEQNIREEERTRLLEEQQKKAAEVQSRHGRRPPHPSGAVPGLQARTTDTADERQDALRNAKPGGQRLKQIRQSVRDRVRRAQT